MDRDALDALNASLPADQRVEYLGSAAFGPKLAVERYRLSNGLDVLVCEDHSAPVVAYHTWFRVGSRHEREGKTGLAHLFEHLMFNETENLPKGEFDRRLEEAGADTNASTWLDWTHYNIAVPEDQLPLVIRLEAERMGSLVLKEPQVESEKEVVANERRYRVDDDVEGAINEVLWATAYTKHPYHHPTIGWMADIQGFTTEDCRGFYEAYYAPNNACVVVVGDVQTADLLRQMVDAYGALAPFDLPLEDSWPEPTQNAERRVELTQPTTTEKVAVAYHAPALGDFDHPALAVLNEVLSGGRASRLYDRLVTQLELASEVRTFLGPFRDPGLLEVYASAREGVSARRLLEVIDEELGRLLVEPVPTPELERACARIELGLLGGLENVDGRASTIGFYETVLGRPGAAFERLEAMQRVTSSDLLRVARRYLKQEQRTLVLVYPTRDGQEAA
ncbi:MAG: insulinase family protein [Myxococcales bacterium]|nr:insulinase family protein [Myxococcales bacterium]